MARKMFRLRARRNNSERWTAWVVTNSYDKLMHHIRVIRSYGWQWLVTGGEVI